MYILWKSVKNKSISIETRIMLVIIKRGTIANGASYYGIELHELHAADELNLKIACDHALDALDIWTKLANKARKHSDKSYYSQACARAKTLARKLTTELEIIINASNVPCGPFAPSWGLPPPSLFFGTNNEKYLYVSSDSSVFSFSAPQQAALNDWRRVSDISGTAPVHLMHSSREHDLVQEIGTNCSVVASLCAMIVASQWRRKSVLCGIMYPYDEASDRPLLSPIGKYLFRMHFNGIVREVIIDDRLPMSSGGHPSIIVHDRNNPHLVWPALLEKAYLKLRGCRYDFPGSNSAVDLAVLTGWIPEQIFIRNGDNPMDKIWEQLSLTFDRGLVMVTLGTATLLPEEECAGDFSSGHNYVVLNIDKSPVKRLLIKNPWAPSVSRPNHSPRAVQGTTSSVVQSLHDESNDHSQVSPEAVWMNLTEISRHFTYIYLNWSPSLFKKTHARHFEWQVAELQNSTNYLRNPQFCISSSHGGMAWILLEKHLTETTMVAAPTDNSGQASETLSPSRRVPVFISIQGFESDGTRVDVNDCPVYEGVWVSSTHTLAKFKMNSTKKYTVVILQDPLPLKKQTYSLIAYSPHDITIEEATESMKVARVRKGAWTCSTAGGNSHSATYFRNPQFVLDLSAATPLKVVLESTNQDFCVRVDIAWTGGNRVVVINNRDLVANSGDYRKGSSIASMSHVEPGKYTIICSTFECQQISEFTLSVGAMVEFQLDELSPEHAGRKVTRADVVFSPGERRKRAHIMPTRVTKMFVLAFHLGPVSRSAIRVSLVAGTGPNCQLKAISNEGHFQWAASSGVRTPEISISPGHVDLWMCVEVTNEHLDESEHLVVQILSEQEVCASTWEVVDDFDLEIL